MRRVLIAFIILGLFIPLIPSGAATLNPIMPKGSKYVYDEGEHCVIKFMAYSNTAATCTVSVSKEFSNGTRKHVMNVTVPSSAETWREYDIGPMDMPQNVNYTEVKINVAFKYSDGHREAGDITVGVFRKPVYYKLGISPKGTRLNFEAPANETFRIMVWLDKGPMSERQLAFGSDAIADGWNMTVVPGHASALYVYVWDRYGQSSAHGNGQDGNGLQYHYHSYMAPERTWTWSIPMAVVGGLLIIGFVVIVILTQWRDPTEE
jgi:hypothetical protein